MFDDGSDNKSKRNSGNAPGGNGVSNDDDELLLDNYLVKVNEVYNPDGEQTEESKLMM